MKKTVFTVIMTILSMASCTGGNDVNETISDILSKNSGSTAKSIINTTSTNTAEI